MKQTQQTRESTHLTTVYDSNQSKDPAATDTAEDGEAHVVRWLKAFTILESGGLSGHHLME